MAKLSPVKFFHASLPLGTVEDPLKQLDWIVDGFIKKYANSVTRRSIKDSINVYFKRSHSQRLTTVGGGALVPFDLGKHCDAFILYDFTHWLQKKELAPHTVKKVIQQLAAIIKYCMARGWSKPFQLIKPRLPRPQRNSTLFDPYSAAELNYIRMAIQPSLIRCENLNLGYVRTGVGYDPRTKKHIRLADGTRGSHFAIWDNVVWYFECVLKCQALPLKTLEDRGHAYFVAKAQQFHGGIEAVYDRLGTGKSPTAKSLAPLLIKLAWETGLNPSTLYVLKRDCFQPEHPLTGQPYLRYYKERGQGETDLHLALFDLKPSPHGIPPDLGVRMLFGKQANLIRKTIETVLQLTESLVNEAAPEHQHLLFLVRRLGRKAASQEKPGIRFQVKGFTKHDVGAWYQALKDDIAVRMKESSNGHEMKIPSHLNLVRFRSTMADRLVREGVDFFAVQAIMGHRSASTTADYLRAHLIEGPIRIELDQHLRKVHTNMQELAASPKPYATVENLKQLGQDGVIYKGVLCDCKNAYDPPDNIKRLLKRAGEWNEGKPCSYYDMCLLSDNLLITRRSLPLIMQHQREIEASSISDTPSAPLYEKKRAVLNDILNYFGPEDIAWAEEIAQSTLPLIDPMTYRGSQNE